MDAETKALVEIANEAGDTRFTGDPEQLERRRIGGWRIAAEVFGGAFLPPLGPGHEADLHAARRHVVVAGRVVVKDGVLVTGDLAEIRATAKEQAARLWKKMESS
jgi:hypothetical protein